MSFHISWPHKGFYISPAPWFFIVQAMGLISLEGPNCEFKGLMTRASEWPPASALRSTHWLLLSCFYPDGVTVGPSDDYRPSGWIISFSSICISGIRGGFLSSLSTGCRGRHRNRAGAFGRSTYCTCPAQGRQVDCTVQGQGREGGRSLQLPGSCSESASGHILLVTAFNSLYCLDIKIMFHFFILILGKERERRNTKIN